MKIINTLFITLLFSLPFNQVVNAQSDTNSVVIKRDVYGTPHIYAEDDYHLFYGYGYVLAEDRLYQLEMLKRSTQGTVAEVLGGDYAEFDKNQRTLFWPDDIREQMSSVDANTQALFKGFAAGINARIVEVQKNKETLMPLEFNANGFAPGKWTDYDVVMLYVGSMLLRYGDFNTEIENHNFLIDLTKEHGPEAARLIFDAVIPASHSSAPTTIPSQDWQESAVNNREQSTPVEHKIALSHKTDQTYKRGHAFSNALVLGPERLEDAQAVLVNGPQFGWYVPAYTYSVGFHSPTWDAVGNAPLGYPLPMFGYNKFITWGSTWAVSDNVDIFRETLNPDNHMEYKHDGVWKKLRARQEVIRVKDAEDIEFAAFQSVHGPVVYIDEAGSKAYSKRRGWAGRELLTLIGWIEATQAKNHDEWLQAVGKSGLNVNWYFADKKGNIGYGAMGAYPERAVGHDNRLPVSGEGSMDWIGINPPSKNPQVFNPSSHYIANWNNKPGAGIKNPDEWWASWSEADRIKVIDDAVAKAGKLTADEAWNLMMTAAFVDPNASYFRPEMLEALSNTVDEHPEFAQYKDILQDWDGTFALTTGAGTANSAMNGYKHPGNALFRSWLTEMMKAVLADDLSGDIGALIANTSEYGTPSHPTAAGLNISVGFKLLYEVLQGRPEYDFLNGKTSDDLWLESLATTVTKLTSAYGANTDDWHEPVPATRFNNVNFLGIPQALDSAVLDDMPDMNRGTENNMTVFSDGKHVGYEVVPPGQSGFIDPNGVKAKHYDDQYLMYQNLERKRTWLNDQDVEANIEREYRLIVEVPKP